MLQHFFMQRTMRAEINMQRDIYREKRERKRGRERERERDSAAPLRDT